MHKLTQEKVPGIPENNSNTDNTDEYISRALPVHAFHSHLFLMYVTYFQTYYALTIVTGFSQKHKREIYLCSTEKNREHNSSSNALIIIQRFLNSQTFCKEAAIH